MKLRVRLALRQLAKEANALKNCTLFHHLSDASQDQLVEAMQFEKIVKGTALCEQGEIADKMYLLIKGHCTVHVNHLHVATLNELDIFGEGVIVNHGDRSTLRVATVTAAENIEVLVLSGTELSRLIETQVLDAETIQELKELALKRKDQNEEKAATELLANGVRGGAAATTSKRQHIHQRRRSTLATCLHKSQLKLLLSKSTFH